MSPHKLQIDSKTPWLVRWGIWLFILLHVLRGALTLCIIFPFASAKKKEDHIQRWSKKLLGIFHIEVKIIGVELLPNAPYLLVSNHISWLDIHVINAFGPIRFVAKSEVAAWPIFGWMAKQLRTVFIRRDSSRHAREVVGQLADVLRLESICIFPEGTSTVGDEVLPFKPNLFESAVSPAVPVVPMAIEYISKATGKRSYAPAFIGDMGLLESMSNVVLSRRLMAQLTILPAISTVAEGGFDRKILALSAQKAIASVLQ